MSSLKNNNNIISLSDDDDDDDDINKVYHNSPPSVSNKKPNLKLDDTTEEDMVSPVKKTKPTTTTTTTTTTINKPKTTNTSTLVPSKRVQDDKLSSTITTNNKSNKEQPQSICLLDSDDDDVDDNKDVEKSKASSFKTSKKSNESSSTSSSKRKINNDENDSNNNNNVNKKKKKENKDYDDYDMLSDNSTSFLRLNNDSNYNIGGSTILYDDDIDKIPDSDLENFSDYNDRNKKSNKSSSSSSSSITKLTKSTKQTKPTKSTTKKQPKPKKITKETCLSETYIIIDENLRNDQGFDDIHTQLLATTDNIEFQETKIPYSIRFLRKPPQPSSTLSPTQTTIDQHQQQQEQQENIIESPTFEKFIILKYSAKLLTTLINEGTLSKTIGDIKRENQDCKFTLLIESLDRHLSEVGKQKYSKQEVEDAMSNNKTLPNKKYINRSTIETIFTQIQMDFSFTIRPIEVRNDIVNYISKSYKTIALLPLRNEDQLFEGFCADSIKKKGKNQDLTEIWINQLCQISGISSNIARGIVAKYPTFSSLTKLYSNEKDSESIKQNLLKNVKIDQQKGTKNLGPVLSSKIFQVFTSKDPNKIIY